MKFLWKQLYKTLDQSRPEGKSWREIAREGKFSPSLFTRLSQDKAISVVNLFKITTVCKIPDGSLRAYLRMKH